VASYKNSKSSDNPKAKLAWLIFIMLVFSSFGFVGTLLLKFVLYSISAIAFCLFQSVGLILAYNIASKIELHKGNKLS